MLTKLPVGKILFGPFALLLFAFPVHAQQVVNIAPTAPPPTPGAFAFPDFANIDALAAAAIIQTDSPSTASTPAIDWIRHPILRAVMIFRQQLKSLTDKLAALESTIADLTATTVTFQRNFDTINTNNPGTTAGHTTGITLYDTDTGNPYCLIMKSGDLLHEEGTCSNYFAPPSTSTPPIAAVTATSSVSTSTDSTSSPQANATITSPFDNSQISLPATSTDPTTNSGTTAATTSPDANATTTATAN